MALPRTLVEASGSSSAHHRVALLLIIFFVSECCYSDAVQLGSRLAQRQNGVLTDHHRNHPDSPLHSRTNHGSSNSARGFDNRNILPSNAHMTLTASGIAKSNRERDEFGQERDTAHNRIIYEAPDRSEFSSAAAALGWDIGFSSLTNSRGYPNQDNYLVELFSRPVQDENASPHSTPRYRAQATIGVFALADGHGPARERIASEIALAVVHRLVTRAFSNASSIPDPKLRLAEPALINGHLIHTEREQYIQALLLDMFAAADVAVHERGVGLPESGTTLSAVIWDLIGEKVYTANVGDSPIVGQLNIQPGKKVNLPVYGKRSFNYDDREIWHPAEYYYSNNNNHNNNNDNYHSNDSTHVGHNSRVDRPRSTGILREFGFRHSASSLAERKAIRNLARLYHLTPQKVSLPGEVLVYFTSAKLNESKEASNVSMDPPSSSGALHSSKYSSPHDTRSPLPTGNDRFSEDDTNESSESDEVYGDDAADINQDDEEENVINGEEEGLESTTTSSIEKTTTTATTTTTADLSLTTTTTTITTTDTILSDEETTAPVSFTTKWSTRPHRHHPRNPTTQTRHHTSSTSHRHTITTADTEDFTTVDADDLVSEMDTEMESEEGEPMKTNTNTRHIQHKQNPSEAASLSEGSPQLRSIAKLDIDSEDSEDRPDEALSAKEQIENTSFIQLRRRLLTSEAPIVVRGEAPSSLLSTKRESSMEELIGDLEALPKVRGQAVLPGQAEGGFFLYYAIYPDAEEGHAPLMDYRLGLLQPTRGIGDGSGLDDDTTDVTYSSFVRRDPEVTVIDSRTLIDESNESSPFLMLLSDGVTTPYENQHFAEIYAKENSKAKGQVAAGGGGDQNPSSVEQLPTQSHGHAKTSGAMPSLDLLSLFLNWWSDTNHFRAESDQFERASEKLESLASDKALESISSLLHESLRQANNNAPSAIRLFTQQVLRQSTNNRNSMGDADDTTALFVRFQPVRQEGKQARHLDGGSSGALANSPKVVMCLLVSVFFAASWNF